MSHVIVKPFKSVNRKFNAGDAVTTSDVGVSLDDLVARGFIKEQDESGTSIEVAAGLSVVSEVSGKPGMFKKLGKFSGI